MTKKEKNRLGKKGIFFTLISLVLVTIITHIFTQGSAGIGNNEATKVRVVVLDSFISKMETSFIPLAVEAAAYKGINRTVWYMDGQNIWLSDPGRDLGSVIKNGTLEGAAFGGTRTLLSNNTLLNFTERMREIASASYGMEMSIVIHDVTLSQISPWQMEADVNFSLSAKSSVANWSRQHIVVQTAIPIEGLQDPLYATNTNGAYAKVIHRSSIQPTEWSVAGKFADFVGSGNYTSFTNSNAPSYLERFRQIPLASSCCGIESTITDALLPLAMRNDEKSYADYQYFASSGPCPDGGSPADLYDISIAGITAPFRFDIDHINKYRIDYGDASQITC